MYDRKSWSADLKAQEVRDRVREVAGKILTDAHVDDAETIRDAIVIAVAHQHLLVAELPESSPFTDGQLVQGENYFNPGETLTGSFVAMAGVNRNPGILMSAGGGFRLLKAGTVVAVDQEAKSE